MPGGRKNILGMAFAFAPDDGLFVAPDPAEEIDAVSIVAADFVIEGKLSALTAVCVETGDAGICACGGCGGGLGTATGL